MSTAWIRSLELPTSDAGLKAAVRVQPKPAGPIHREPVDIAVDLLVAALETPYRASDQHVQIIRRVVGPYAAHARLHYASEDQFVRAATGSLQLPPDPRTTVLTGHPGVGKTAVLAAIRRLMNTDRVVQASSSLPPFPLKPVVHVPIRANVRKSEMYTRIAEQAGVDETYLKGSAGEARHLQLRLYQHGCCGLSTDELQFVTRGSEANAQVAMLLTRLTDFGIPLTFACNFSLVHKLKGRRPEERVRMLSAPIVMLPDDPGDPDYLGYLDDLKIVMDGTLAIDPSKDAAEINAWTFGLKRPLIRLLAVGYRIARQRALPSDGRPQVTMDDLRAAYRSTDYQTDRDVVEGCQRALMGITTVKQDFVCPFDLPPPQELMMKQRAERSYQRALASAELADAKGAAGKNSTGPTGARAESGGAATASKLGKRAATPKARATPPRTADGLLAGLAAMRQSR